MLTMLPKRKQIRLKGYDYSQNGYYFVTICTQDKGNVLGGIQEDNMKLSQIGSMVEEWWLELANKYPNIKLYEYILMPNHIHGIIEIETVGAGFPRPKIELGRENRAPTLGNMIAYFKYQSTKDCRSLGYMKFDKLWQRNYFERVVRSEQELSNIREYIVENPKNWKKDKLFFQKKS